MSDSPTSPYRSQFSENRPLNSASAVSAPSTASFALGTTTMTSQVLSAPSGPLQYGYGVSSTDPGVTGYLASYHRSRAQSNPSQQVAFMPTAPSIGQSVMYGAQQPMYQFSAGLAGPLSTLAVPKVSRSGSRRAKAHVAKACQNCKKAHLSCDESRPCNRCISTRKEATCVDVEHKKRGRPRIQSGERGPTRPLMTQTPSLVIPNTQTAPEGYGYPSHEMPASRRGSLPVIGSTAVGEIGYGQLGPRGGQHLSYLPPRTEPPWYAEPLYAFLNLDLRFLKVSESVRRLLGDRRDMINAPLNQYVELRHSASLGDLQTWLRNERQRIERGNLPRITSSEQEMEAVQSLSESDMDRVTLAERPEMYAFKLASGQSEHFSCVIRLARTEELFFAALTMHRLPNPPPTYSSRPPAEQHGSSGVGRRDTLASEPAFGPPGPSSPYQRSAPSSPFGNMPRQLMTTLPPPIPSAVRSVDYLSPSHREQTAIGYFPPQQSSMHPPPYPFQSSSSQQSSISRSRRPEPLGGGYLAAPPAVSSSAPTTPVGAQFSLDQRGPPGSASSALGDGRGSATVPGSVQRRRLSQGSDEVEEMEGSKKRRRLNVGDIIEK